MQSPILFIIFNRPSQTKIVFESIKNIKPKELYIAADGPRKNNINDADNCKLAREIVNNIDWNCDVKYLFRNENLGCKKAVSEAINWFFENVEEGIILEDDCLPNESFFNFCSTLLEKYRSDNEVMHIGGTNFQPSEFTIEAEYYFSRITHIWGWATWRRAWEKYHQELPDYTTNQLEDWFNNYEFNKRSLLYWDHAFNMIKEQAIDTWDYQWTYCLWKNKGIAIVPKLNLVSNIGFGLDATHTEKGAATYANLPTYSMEITKHPKDKNVNTNADNYTFNKWYVKRSLITRVMDIIKKITQ